MDSKIKRRRNIDGSIADIQKSMKALYTEIENISLFVSSSKDIYDKMETRLEKESNSFIDRMEDIAGLKKEWYQENWFKIAVGTVVTGIAIAVVVVVGPELMFIAVGTVVGGGIYGLTEGIESIRNGGEFIDGFSDGFMKGTIETFLAETVGCAGVGVGAKLFAGGTINSLSYTVSTQLNDGTISAPDLAFEFAKGVGAIAAGEVVFAGIAKYVEKGLAKSVINEVKTAENPEIVGKEAKEIIEGGGRSCILSSEEAEEISFNAIKGKNNADAIVLGKFGDGGPTAYTNVAKSMDAQYFQLDNWNELASKYSDDEIWKINEKFLDIQISSGREVYLSHNPEEYIGDGSFYSKEIQYLLDNVYYKFIKEGDVWHAIR